MRHTIQRRIKGGALALLPSFIILLIDPSQKTGTKLFATSYIDGLRGLAAFIVYSYHLYAKYMPGLLPLYGLPAFPDGSPARSSIVQLPYLRLVISGRPMVHIFFVVSGYALSLKSLKQIRSNQNAAVLDTLSSLLFRRALRLFLPVLFSTFLGLVLLQLRLRNGYQDTMWKQFQVWYAELQVVTNFWDPNSRHVTDPDPHLWTIPLEMANSVILFAIIIGLARCTAAVRMSSVVCLAIGTMYVGQWVASEFSMGLFLAELGLIQDEYCEFFDSEDGLSQDARIEIYHTQGHGLLSNSKGVDGLSQTQLRLVQLWRLQTLRKMGKMGLQIFCAVSLIIALWIAGWPELHAHDSPTFTWLANNTSSAYNTSFGRMQFPWFGLVAFLIVFACQQHLYLQRILVNPAVQYLGKISYSLYLMHWSVVECIAPRIIPSLLQFVQRMYVDGIIGPWGITMVWALSILGITPAVIWASDLFSRACDKNCVAFTKWLEEKCVVVNPNID